MPACASRKAVRSLRSGVEDDTALSLGELRMDRPGRRVHRAGREVELSRTEFDLLEVLVHNQGVVLARDRLYELVWGGELQPESKTLDVYIGYLRRKLEAEGEPRLIHTVRGIGYVAREES